MNAVIHCPSCSAPLAVTPDMVGKLIACPACDQRIQLGEVATSAAVVERNPLQPTDSSVKNRNGTNSVRQQMVLVAALSVLAGLIIAGGIIGWRAAMAKRQQPDRADLPPSARIRPATGEPSSLPPDALQSQEADNSDTAVAAERTGLANPPQSDSATRQSAFSGPPPSAFPTPPSKPPPATVVSPQAPSSRAADTRSRSAADVTLKPTNTVKDPLAGVPAACQLPALVATGPERLLSLASEPVENFDVSIRTAAASVLAEAAFYTELDSTQPGWIVGYVADISSGAGKLPLAIICRQGLDLTWCWAQPAAELDLRKQLANCQLELRHDNASRLVQLRMPLATGPLTLDMTKDVQTVEFPLADLPRPEKLHLDIEELIRFAKGGRIRGSASSLALGKQLIVEFADQPGAEIHIRLFRPSNTADLTLRVEPVFRENAAREFDLTLPRLDALKSAAEENVARDKSQLSGAKDAMDALKSRLETARANPPSNIQQMTAWQQGVASLVRNLDRAADRVQTLERRIAENQARLDAVPNIRSFLNSLHQRAQIRYRLCAECGEQDVVLVNGVTARKVTSE